MPDTLSLLEQQHADYQILLNATLSLLSGPMEADAVRAYLAQREHCLTATGRREAALTAALARPASDQVVAAVRAYRELLETLVDAERRLLAAAESLHATLGDELRQLGHGYRALGGYRGPERGAARAINQRV